MSIASVRVAAWRKANPEKLAVQRSRQRRPSAARQRISNAKWRSANPEKARSAFRKWARANLEYFRIAVATRRARKLAGGGSGITAEQHRQLVAGSLGICAYCNGRRKLTLDHIEPFSRGGAHDVDNAAMACGFCNSSKHGLPLLVWLARRKMGYVT